MWLQTWHEIQFIYRLLNICRVPYAIRIGLETILYPCNRIWSRRSKWQRKRWRDNKNRYRRFLSGHAPSIWMKMCTLLLCYEKVDETLSEVIFNQAYLYQTTDRTYIVRVRWFCFVFKIIMYSVPVCLVYIHFKNTFVCWFFSYKKGSFPSWKLLKVCRMFL